MSNRGTSEGNVHEKDIVQYFNQNKNSKDFNQYFQKLNLDSTDNYWMCRVTTMQLSRLSNSKVHTRADSYLIYSKDTDLINLIEENEYYLDEKLLYSKKFNFEKIDNSGISIKLWDSKSYQILKLTPNSFKTLFGNTELGAGSSIYCTKTQDLFKNKDVIEGWQTNSDDMVNFFKNEINEEESLYLKDNFHEDLESCKKVKQISNYEIQNRINSDDLIQKKIFNGIDLYEEPYTAHFFIKDKGIVELEYIPFSITTGSGRSRGDYTVVLKPKK